MLFHTILTLTTNGVCSEFVAAPPASAASALVQRDLHCALLRAVEGRVGRGAPLPVPPLRSTSLKNVLPAVAEDHWALRVVKVLEPEFLVLESEVGAADAVAVLAAGEYCDVPTEGRLAIVRALVTIALQGDIVRCALACLKPVYFMKTTCIVSLLPVAPQQAVSL